MSGPRGEIVDFHHHDCGSVGGGFPHPASAHNDPEEVDRLARFLLEHDHCGDDWWDSSPDRRKNFYRVLARDVMAYFGSNGEQS